jgi:predicted RNA polymerase sigma factor
VVRPAEVVAVGLAEGHEPFGTAVAHRAVEAVWLLESARIIAGLAGLVRDVGLAEELAQDALVAALEQWPAEGIPANPERG